jgi:GMP synthase (glutamine-hydrolysing)
VKPLLIIKTGRTLPQVPAVRGDFERWILESMGWEPAQSLTCDVSAGAALPAAEAVCGVVITGSAAMVSERLPWSERCAEWLLQAAGELPILGICYGHQLLAHALGGGVDYHPRGREMGTTFVRCHPGAGGDPLFAGCGEQFAVHVTHQQSVLQLPAGAEVLASNDFEPHQALRFRERVWGLQFHPEFDAEVMRAYLGARAQRLQEEGFDVAQLLAAVSETPQSRQVLRNFATLLGRAR